MKWEVAGADSSTGEEKRIIIEADTEDSARRRGNRRGLLVSSVRAIDPDDSVSGELIAPPQGRTAPPVRHQAAPPPPTVPTVAAYVNAQTHIDTGPLKNGWGIAAAILGAIALAVSFIPCVGLVGAVPLAVIGVILAVVGLIVGYAHGRPVLTSWLGGAMCLCSVVIAFVITSVLAGGVGAAAQQAAKDMEQARLDQASRARSPSATSPSAGPASAEDWVDGRKGATLGSFSVRVTDVEVRSVPLKDFMNESQESEKEHLLLTIEIRNTDASKKLDYRTWRGRGAVFGDRDYASVEDEFGNAYKRINFGVTTKISGAAADVESIYPGKTVTDKLVFQPPVANAKALMVELPAGNLSGSGTLRLKVELPTAK